MILNPFWPCFYLRIWTVWLNCMWFISWRWYLKAKFLVAKNGFFCCWYFRLGFWMYDMVILIVLRGSNFNCFETEPYHNSTVGVSTTQGSLWLVKSLIMQLLFNMFHIYQLPIDKSLFFSFFFTFIVNTCPLYTLFRLYQDLFSRHFFFFFILGNTDALWLYLSFDQFAVC